MTSDDIAVSIIVPVYNVENYLHDCLNSLLDQSLENIEIICIDDCSTDSSYSILEYFEKKDNRIKIYKNKENVGLGATRNVGINKASGKYIQFLDSDDWLDNNCVKKCFDISEKNQLDFLIFKLINFDEISRTFFKTDYYSMEFMDKYLDKTLSTNVLNDDIIFRMANSACNKFYLKSFLIDNEIYFPEGLIHEDNPFYFRIMFESKKFMIIDEYFYNRRVRLNSITQSYGKELLDILNIADLVLSYFIENKIYHKYSSFVINYFVSVIKNKFYLIDYKYRMKYFSLMKKLFNKYYRLYGLKNDFNKKLYFENRNFFNLVIDSENFIEYNHNIKQLKALQKNFKISIVVPIYNAKKNYIQKSFNSIKDQSIGFENLEVIFVDDCSNFKEGTKYIQQLNDLYPNVKSIFLDENKGPGNARNTGINNSSSEYIMFLDHDDYYLKNACEILYKNMKKYKVNMVCGNYINNSRDGKKVNWTNRNINKKVTKYGSVFDNTELFKIDPSIWSRLYKKSFLIEKNLYFKNFRSGQDLIFYQETLFNANSMLFVDEPIVFYEIRKENENNLSSISLNNSESILKTLIDVYNYSYNLFISNGCDELNIPLNNLNYWVNYRFLNSTLEFEEFKHIINYSSSFFDKYLEFFKDEEIKNKELFELISNKEYVRAFSLYKQLKNN